MLAAALASGVASARALELDLAAAPFCDSSGLREISEAHRAATAAGNRMIVSNAGPSILRVMRIIGLEPLLGKRDDPSSA